MNSIIASFINNKESYTVVDTSWLKNNVNYFLENEICILNEPVKDTIEFTLWKLAQNWADYIFPEQRYKLCVTSSGIITPWSTSWHTDDNLLTASMCIYGPSTQWKISNDKTIYDCSIFHTVIFKGNSAINGNPLVHRAPLQGPRLRFQACLWDFKK